jgi:Polyketide cyclase / dehydrase and lipid transport
VQINESAPRGGVERDRGAASSDVVWEVIADFELAGVDPAVKSMSIDGPVAEGTQFKWKAGPGTITSTIQEVERPRIGWNGKTFGTNAVHVWRFEPRDNGTLVHTEESWEGTLPRLLSARMQKALQERLDKALPHLKAEAERRASA